MLICLLRRNRAFLAKLLLTIFFCLQAGVLQAALTDMGAITGTLYYSLPPASPLPVPGQTVNLYLDTGNSVWDGSGVDPFVALSTTDSSGVYRFDGLTAGTYFVVQPPDPSGFLTPYVNTVVITPALAAGTPGLTIDPFGGTVQTLTASLPASATVTGSRADASILGGVRNVRVNSFSGDSLNMTARINAGGTGRLSYTEDAGAYGDVIVLWNGVAEQESAPPTTLGLGGGAGIDLTAGGTIDSFDLNLYRNDLSADQTITVYTDATHASALTFSVVGHGVAPLNLHQRFAFSSFTPLPGYAAADFSVVRAISLRVTIGAQDQLGGLDYESDFLTTAGPGTVISDLPYNINSAVNLVKRTNGTDNNTAPGILVSAGSTVTWTYTVTNAGNVPLTNVIVTDDQGVVPLYQGGDTNSNGLLDLTETWVYQATGTAVAGQHTNTGMVSGRDILSLGLPVADTDTDHYFGVNPQINLVVLTNGTDNNAVTGPLVAVGSTVTWTYTVTNTGNVPLKSVTVVDDHTGVPVYVSGDTNNNLLLDLTEIWVYQANGTATAGQYTNTGTVTGFDNTNTVMTQATKTDPDHYFGVNPSIKLVKLTNGTDNNAPPGPLVAVGSTVTWTYMVTNTGNVPLKNVTVTDDQAGVTPVYQSGDINSNLLLDPTETWVYQATGTAVAGQYANTGTARGLDNTNTVVTPVSATDPDHYFGATAPLFTSSNAVTFTVGSFSSFTVTTSGSPLPSLSENGGLPSGVNFVDNGNGTGLLSGTPSAGSNGFYPVTFNAANGLLPNATQNFTLTVCSPSITVTSNADSGADSLRQAIADICPGGTITFDNALSGGTITLTTSTLAIPKNLTIDGSSLSSPVAIGGGSVRVFIVNNGISFNLNGVTVANGSSTLGGGLFNGGTVTITNSTFSGNSTVTGGGGGLYNAAGRTVTITNSTFSGNYANSSVSGGGGLYNDGTATITNSTFSGNSANGAGEGGGLYNGSGAVVNITNSTFSGNSANGGLGGGGLYNAGTATVRNTIIANSPSGRDCQGTLLATSSNNLIESTGANACNLANGADGNIIGVDPKLSALGSYGGPTQTFALLPGSLAIGAGNNAICAAPVGAPLYGAGGLDQRGIVRPQGVACDIGAYEVAPAASVTTLASSSNPSVLGQFVTFTATVTSGATGSVTFKDGGADISGCAAQPLSGAQATCTTSALAVGNHTITADYSGDVSFAGSTGSLTGNPQVVSQAFTTTVVTSAPNPSIFGQSVTLTATVTAVPPGAGVPAGTVSFFSDSTQIPGCSAISLNGNGQAGCATSTLTVGNHTITASFNSAGNFSGSTSPPMTQQVTAADQNALTVLAGSPLTYKLSEPLSTTGGSGTGAVTYQVTSGSCTITGAQLNQLTANSGTGSCMVTATKAADGNYNAATSAPVIVALQQVLPVISFGSVPSPTFPGPDFTLSATTTNTDSSALSFSVVSGPCSLVSGSTFRPTGAGICVIQAASDATGNFGAASQTLRVAIAAATAPTAVPTLNEWGMLLFLLLAGVGSVYHIRRSRGV